MLKDLKLGAKMGLGYGALILISLILGSMAVVSMLNITQKSKMLANEYVPEVDIANNVERNSLLTMYNMRGYALSKDQKYLDESKKYLTDVKKYLTDANKLSVDSKHLVKLGEAVVVVNAAVNEYEKLAEETVSANNAIIENQKELITDAGVFMENCNAYLISQNEKMDEEIIANIGKVKLQERHKKITLINDVIDLGNAVRLALWQAQANRDPETFKQATSIFDDMDAKLAEIRTITSQAVNITQLNNIKKAADGYLESGLALLDNWYNLEDLNTKRGVKADEVLAEAQKVSFAGLEQTTSIAKGAVTTLNVSSTTMIVGLFIAIILGIFLAVSMTKIITGPLIKGINFAQIIANGDMTATLDVDQKDEIGDLANALRNMISNITRVIADVQSAADNVASGSQQLSSSSQEMSQGASEQAAAAEEASSSMEQMSSNIEANADNAQQTEKIALKASKDAEESGRAVTETVTAMNEIASKISIIEEIARQTDLLALNAAIEAARAGEHGKGFAVVADGVRKLAERSQETAAEINKLAGSSSEVAKRAGEMLKQLVPDIQRTADLVQEISAASIEQRTGSEQINKAIQQLDEVIQQNASSAEEMSSTSEELASQAEQLLSSIEFFKLDTNGNGNSKRQAVLGKPKPAGAKHINVAHMNANKAKPKNGKVAISMGSHTSNSDPLDSDFEKF